MDGVSKYIPKRRKAKADKSKVFIGITAHPGHAYCRETFVSALRGMVRHASQVDVEVCVAWNGYMKPWGFRGYKSFNYKPKDGEKGIDILCNKQNLLREKFLESDCDYYLNLETDTIPPKNALTKLVEADKDIVSALYMIQTQEFQKFDLKNLPKKRGQIGEAIKQSLDGGHSGVVVTRQRMIPTVWGIFGTKSRLWDLEDALPQRGLVRVFSSGMGCLLIKREVLEKLNFKIQFGGLEQQFTDFIFHKEAYDLGYQAFVDTDVWCNHLHKDFDDQVFRKWFNPKKV